MTKIISVTSGKGGVGKSTVSAGVAAAFARRGKKTLIVELDMGLRGLDLMLGMENRIVYDLGDVLQGRCLPWDAVVQSEEIPRLWYLAAPSRTLLQFRFEDLVKCVNDLKEKFDIIILDTPAGLGISMMAVRDLSDYAVIVATPDPVCIRDGAKVAEMMEEMHFSDYGVMINRVSRAAVRKSSIHDLDDVIDGVGAPLIGVLTEDLALQNAQSRGLILPEDTRPSKVFVALSKRLEGIYVPLVIDRL